MNVNDLFNGYTGMLSFLNKNGLNIDEHVVFDVTSVSSENANNIIQFNNINFQMDRSMQLYFYFKLPQYNSMFGRITFSESNINILIDTHIEMHDNDLKRSNITLKQFIDSINKNAVVGEFTVHEKLILYSISYEYHEFANPTNERLMLSFISPILSAYTIYKPDLAIKYLS